MYQTALKTYLMAQNAIADRKAELDEKALLIALFVIAAIAGLTTLATAISGRFTNLAATL